MNGGRKRRGYLFLVPGSVSSPECVIGEQRLGEFSAKFAMPGCHTGGPVRWSVAGTGKTAISHFHSPNRCSPITVSDNDVSSRHADYADSYKPWQSQLGTLE